MKRILDEYGKIVIAVLICAIIALVLFYKNGILDTLNVLKAENPVLSNGESTQTMNELSKLGVPVLVVKDKTVQLGSDIRLSDMVVSAKQGSMDLKDKVCYFLEDGTQIENTERVPATILGDKVRSARITFRVEGDKQLRCEKQAVATICAKESVPGAKELLASWEIGETGANVMANIYQEGSKQILSIEGNGNVKKNLIIPWMHYKNGITTVSIADTVTANDISGWFQDFQKLIEVPQMPDTVLTANHTFTGCISLVSGYIPQNAVSIDGIYQDCGNLKSIAQVPASVKSCNAAFENCVSLCDSMYFYAQPTSYAACLKNVAKDTNHHYLTLYYTKANQNIIETIVAEGANYSRLLQAKAIK